MNTYIADLVRTRDYPHYVLTFFAPRAKRQALLAVFALNGELAAIRQLAQDPTMRLIRIQWWRDSLDKLYKGGTAPSPVLQALHDNDVSLVPLHVLVDAHESGRATDDALYTLCADILGRDKKRFFKKLEKLRTIKGGRDHPLLAFRLWSGI